MAVSFDLINFRNAVANAHKLLEFTIEHQELPSIDHS